MRRHVIVSVIFVCMVTVMPPQAQCVVNGDGENHDASEMVTVSVIEQMIGSKKLELRYQIENASDRDIWICDSMELHSRRADVDVYVGLDNETLFVQRRLEVPIGYRDPPTGRYVRVRSGETRTETMSFSLPVHHRVVLFGARGSQPREHATRLVLEIGYYEGDLPATVFRMLEEAEKVALEEPGTLPAFPTDLVDWMGGSLYFNVGSENVRARDEQVEIPWTDQALKGEKILRMTVDGLAIPYSSQENKPTAIHLSPCKRIDIRFRRSPLEFFFPYPQEQALLSLEEKRYLQSLKDFAVEDQWGLMNIAYHSSEAKDGTFFTERGVADLTCTRKDGSTVSLTVYDDAYVVTPDGQVFRCVGGIPKLRMLSPQIESFDLRVQCAAKLNNLWHRLRLYHIARHAPRDSEEYWQRYRSTGRIIPPEVFRKPEKTYPQATDWCDAMQRAYRFVYRGAAMMLQQCPSAGKGRCHYAMNPNCKYDSPSDTVLLFETKAGWNQHGGPELFTFDNHEPKGGCVLLNDGTVKFLRTKEELHKLRWK